MEVSGQLNAPVALPQGKAHGKEKKFGIVGNRTRSGLDIVEKR
jgi:hypothetical protein